MAYKWSWSWGSESAVLLESDLGWTFSNTTTATIEPRTTEQYKPTGGPTRYSMFVDSTIDALLPVAAFSGLDQGVISVAVKALVFSPSATKIIVGVFGATNTSRAIYVTINTGAVSLYVDNVFKSTSATTYDFLNWRFIALHFDMRAIGWTARVTVDGVESNPAASDNRAVDQAGQVLLEGCVLGDRNWVIGPVIVQDTYADTSAPRFVTRISPDADVSTVGTWTPTTGTNHASTGVDPFDAATNTTEATPTIGDEVITNYTGDLTAKLGGVPASVDLVTAHSYSTGLNNTARAEVGDQAGATTTAGTTGIIGSGTTYVYASAPTKPSDGSAWIGTDTPKTKYEVVSV